MTEDKSRSIQEDGYSYLDPLLLQQRRYKLAVGIAVSVLMLVAAGAAFFLYRPVKVSQQQLIEMVEKAIKSQINSSADLQFDDVRAERRDDAYEVTGSVDAVAPGGETGRFKFICLVMRQADGTWAPGKWEVTRLR
jgi:hypothetical protein